MDIPPVIIGCRKCMKETELDELHYRCGHCGSIDIEVIEGEEMLLMSLEMQ